MSQGQHQNQVFAKPFIILKLDTLWASPTWQKLNSGKSRQHHMGSEILPIKQDTRWPQGGRNNQLIENYIQQQAMYTLYYYYYYYQIFTFIFTLIYIISLIVAHYIGSLLCILTHITPDNTMLYGIGLLQPIPAFYKKFKFKKKIAELFINK